MLYTVLKYGIFFKYLFWNMKIKNDKDMSDYFW